MSDAQDMTPEARAAAIAEVFKNAPPEGITDPNLLPPRPPTRRERVTRFENPIVSIQSSGVKSVRLDPVVQEPELPPFAIESKGDRLGPVAFFNRYFNNLPVAYLTSQDKWHGIVATAIKAYRGYVMACRKAEAIGDEITEWRE